LPPPVDSAPTAVQAGAAVHDTLESELTVAPDGFGVGCCAQPVPFHCSARVTCFPATLV
jgi:hypothetical protein